MTEALQEGILAAAWNQTVPADRMAIWHDNLRRSQSEMDHVKGVSIQLGAFNTVAQFMNAERAAMEKLEAEINGWQRDPLFTVQSVFQLGRDAFNQLNLTPIRRVHSRTARNSQAN